MLHVLDVGRTAPVSPEIRNTIFSIIPNGLGVVRVGVVGDGSCYFHSLAAILNYEDSAEKILLRKEQPMHIGHRLRAMVHENLVPEVWNKFWEDRGVKNYPSHTTILKKLTDTREWSDLWIIVFSFALFNLDVMFLDVEENKAYCGITGARNSCSVMINTNSAAKWDRASGFKAAPCTTPGYFDKIGPNARGKLGVIAWVKHSHFEPVMIYKPNAKKIRGATVGPKGSYVSLIGGAIRKSIIENYGASCSTTLADLAQTSYYEGGSNMPRKIP